MSRLPLALFVSALSLFAASPKVNLEVVTTEHAALAAGGTVRFEGSYGELNIEAWDEPGVEVVVTRSAWATDTAAERERVKQAFDASGIKVEARGSDVVVTTAHRKPHSWSTKGRRAVSYQLDYRVMVPRGARLAIQHEVGDVVIGGVEGGIDASVKTGDILLRLPAVVNYTFDADCREGRTHSDFAGSFHRRHFYAEHFTGGASSSAVPVHLHVGIGGIDIR